MEVPQLQELAHRTRSTREAGFALLIATGILGLFLLIPLDAPEPLPPVAVETLAPSAFEHISIDAEAAIVYDLAEGKVLFEKNADAQLPLASLTKLLTVYAALSVLSSGTEVVVSEHAAREYPPRAFSPGESFTLADISKLTLTASLNDGASAIASTAARQNATTENALLASAAASLDLTQTFAVNGSGLDEHATLSGGYGSAYDIAKLAGALASQYPTIAAATTRPEAVAVSNEGVRHSVRNTDPIIDTVPRLLLSKTGFTDLAGGNLAIVFDAGLLHPVAVVVLGSTQDERFTDAQTLIAAAIAHYAGVASL